MPTETPPPHTDAPLPDAPDARAPAPAAPAAQGPARPCLAVEFSTAHVTVFARDAQTEAADGGWGSLGSAEIEGPGFTTRITALAALAAERGLGGAPALLWLPIDQVLTRNLPAGAPELGSLRAARAFIAAETASPPDELAVAVSSVDAAGQVTVAAAFRQTCEEAEDYARRWGFTPVAVGTREAGAVFGPDGPVFGVPLPESMAPVPDGGPGAASSGTVTALWPAPVASPRSEPGPSEPGPSGLTAPGMAKPEPAAGETADPGARRSEGGAIGPRPPIPAAAPKGRALRPAHRGWLVAFVLAALLAVLTAIAVLGIDLAGRPGQGEGAGGGPDSADAPVPVSAAPRRSEAVRAATGEPVYPAPQPISLPAIATERPELASDPETGALADRREARMADPREPSARPAAPAAPLEADRAGAPRRPGSRGGAPPDPSPSVDGAPLDRLARLSPAPLGAARAAGPAPDLWLRRSAAPLRPPRRPSPPRPFLPHPAPEADRLPGPPRFEAPGRPFPPALAPSKHLLQRAAFPPGPDRRSVATLQLAPVGGVEGGDAAPAPEALVAPNRRVGAGAGRSPSSEGASLGSPSSEGASLGSPSPALPAPRQPSPRIPSAPAEPSAQDRPAEHAPGEAAETEQDPAPQPTTEPVAASPMPPQRPAGPPDPQAAGPVEPSPSAHADDAPAAEAVAGTAHAPTERPARQAPAAQPAVPSPRPRPTPPVLVNRPAAASKAADDDLAAAPRSPVFLVPPPPQRPAGRSPARTARQTASAPATLPRLDEVIRAPTARTVRVAARVEGLPLDRAVLIGILQLETGRSALVRTADGQVRRLSRGDAVDGWRVALIGRDALRLERSGRSKTLLLVGR
ncbi:MAG: hypothetical protein ACFBRM_10085 [Pikeienuella sp.]